MGFIHVVKQGEGISQLADRYGFGPRSLWEQAENQELAKVREDPNVLLPGDRLYIPDRESKWVPVAAGRRHVFRKVGVPAKLRLQLYLDRQPRTRQEYRLEIDGSVVASGVTDEEGILEAWVNPQARRGLLTLGSEGQKLHLELGCLDPLTEIAGVQKRLLNLGYHAGSVTGELDDATAAALAAFQVDFNLPPTGGLDSGTRERLGAVHDRPCRFSESSPASEESEGEEEGESVRSEDGPVDEEEQWTADAAAEWTSWSGPDELPDGWENPPLRAS